MLTQDEYLGYDAVGLAGLVRDGDVTAGELVDSAIERMEQVNPAINAVVDRRDARVRDEADVLQASVAEGSAGPLAGVPFLLKSLDAVLGGEVNTFSSRSLVDWRPVEDANLVTRYRDAGLLFLGRTNAPEFGIFGITEPELYGACRNPWDLEHTPGGSSGGSAAAVAAGIVPVAHAGDGGGSIRIPAAYCGIFGLKPSRGRMPLGPVIGEAWDGLVVPHVISRSVRDSAALLDATHGADAGAPYGEPAGPATTFMAAAAADPGTLRIGFSAKSMLGSEIDPECVAAVSQAADLLADLGHEVVEVDLPIDPQEVATAYLTVVAAGIAESVNGTEAKTGRKPDPADFEAATWFLKQVGGELSAVEHLHARDVSQTLGRRIAALYDDMGLDVHMSATTAMLPARIGELDPSSQEAAALSVLRRVPVGRVLRIVLAQLAANSLDRTPNTQVFNMTGQPAMSVPLHWTPSGLPVGVQFAGRFGDEATLLALATQLEQAQPWADRRPGLD